MAVLNDIAAAPSFLKAEVVSIDMYKFGGRDRISLFPQMLEMRFYQSMFNPIMKVEMVILDPIGLHVNYPMVGEEIVEVEVKPTRDDPQDERTPYPDQHTRRAGETNRIKSKFIVSDVRKMENDDKGRANMFVITMYSFEMLHNVRSRVQRAYLDSYTNIIKDLLDRYLDVRGLRINDFNFEATKGIQQVIIPNMHPLEAIQWCAKKSVPENPDHNLFVFYENFEGFHFKTFQDIVEKKGNEDTSTIPKFFFTSHITPELRKLLDKKNLDSKSITAMSINKRYSTVEKFMGGFFENELLEIDIMNKQIRSYQTANKDDVPTGLDKNQLNTPQFMEFSKIKNDLPGTKTRVKYKVSQNGGDNPSVENYFSEKFGEGTFTHMAYSQLSLTIAVAGDTNIQCGSVIKIEIPEMHGFTNIEEDYYISGKYIVTDIKHTITAESKHIMVMNISRDSYLNEIEQTMRYKVGNDK